MIKIDLINKTKNKVGEELIKKSVEIELSRNNIDDVYVSVAVVDGKTMRELVRKYYKKDNEEHPVLTFSNRETTVDFMQSNDVEDLGEIILNYDYAVRESSEFERSTDDLLSDWAAHGVLHLIGKHHD